MLSFCKFGQAGFHENGLRDETALIAELKPFYLPFKLSFEPQVESELLWHFKKETSY